MNYNFHLIPNSIRCQSMYFYSAFKVEQNNLDLMLFSVMTIQHGFKSNLESNTDLFLYIQVHYSTTRWSRSTPAKICVSLFFFSCRPYGILLSVWRGPWENWLRGRCWAALGGGRSTVRHPIAKPFELSLHAV